jgi:hypothetical protein
MLVLLLPLQFLVLKGGTPSVPALLQSMQVRLTHNLQIVTIAPAAHPVRTVLTAVTHHANVSKPSAICIWLGPRRWSKVPRIRQLHEQAGAGPSSTPNLLVRIHARFMLPAPSCCCWTQASEPIGALAVNWCAAMRYCRSEAFQVCSQHLSVSQACWLGLQS